MNRPIGIIDSGVGGLTVAKEVIRQLPNEEIMYLGDTARCPYGPRPVEEVKRFTWEMTEHLLKKDIKMLVIACNTATAMAFEEIKAALSIPVIGVVHPGARTAIKVTKNSHVGVIGTVGTIDSKAYDEALIKINQQIKIESLACPAFVPIVEMGQMDDPNTYNIIETTLTPLKDKAIDTLILGCTHYPLLKQLIQRAMGDSIQLIDSGEETAREVSTILYHRGLLATGHQNPQHHFYTTGSSQVLSTILAQIDISPIIEMITIEKNVTSK